MQSADVQLPEFQEPSHRMKQTIERQELGMWLEL
jgi:hypothetical protein